MNARDDYPCVDNCTSSEHARRAPNPVPVTGTAVAYNAVDLLRAVLTSTQLYWRFAVLLWLVAALFVLACVVGIVWRTDLPQLPELPIPVVMI